jgi:hypothetical protein
MPRIDLNLPEHHRDVPSHVSMDVNKAKQARNVTRRLSFGDRNVIANTGAIVAAFGECGKSRGKKESNSEEQSAHKRPRGLVYGGRCMLGSAMKPQSSNLQAQCYP